MNIHCTFCKNLIEPGTGRTDKRIILCDLCYQQILGDDTPALDKHGGWQALADVDTCINCGELLTWSAILVQRSSWTGVNDGDIIVCDGCVAEFTTTIKERSMRQLEEMLRDDRPVEEL